MQYHYAVFYDTHKNKWNVVYDGDAYFPDGCVWDDVRADRDGYGWFFPEWESDEAAIDAKLGQILEACITCLPGIEVKKELAEVSGQLNFWEAE